MMRLALNWREPAAITWYVVRWAALAVPVAGLVGSACALFLWLLEQATELQWQTPALLYCLPVAGIGVAAAYHWLGRGAERGNDLILDEIHRPGSGVPASMTPLILVGTVVTHFFGGSAGREGTAVQVGGSIASSLGRRMRMNESDQRTLLMMGVAAGFAGVFGTPVTAAIFALEVIAIGRISHESLVPCLLASIIGDWSCTAWGIHHTDYHHMIQTAPALQWPLLGKIVLASALFGIASFAFAKLAHGVKASFQRTIGLPLLRPVVGGLIVIALTLLLGTRDYLGLGVTSPPGERGVSIVSSFTIGGAEPFSWWWKIVFTVVTLGSGFKGGEVTPLFFIGATLGNTLAILLDAPVDLFAALGFVAVFAGATNTPIACTVMGIELFGAGHAVPIAVACCLAYLCSGHSGIYLSQRIATPKVATPGTDHERLERDA